MSRHQNLPEHLLKHRLLGAYSRVSDIVSLGWGPRICISEFSGDADVTGMGASYWEPWEHLLQGNNGDLNQSCDREVRDAKIL